MPEAPHLRVSKKSKVSATVAVCSALVVFLYLFAITNTLSRITTSSTRIQEQKWSWESPESTRAISCDRTHFEYDMCYLKHPTIMDPTTAIFFTEDPTNSTPQLMEKIRPFPRNFKHTPINVVRQLTLTTAPPNVSCAVTHTSPALVFNAGGDWTTNYYHSFNEIFIPLFITVDTFFPDHDFVIGIFNCSHGWVHHYNDILSTYTRHQIIDFNQETATHCFPSAIVGLISHGASTVDPTLQRRPHPKSLLDFRAFLTAKYSQSHHAPPPPWTSKGKPRLVFLNRNGTRGILNVDNIRRAAEDTGFEVFIFEPSRESSMHEAFRVIDSSHAMIAVHGAGLTNMVFQRPGSVLMQMVPAECYWLASLCYGKMAVRFGLEYIVYNIDQDETVSEWDKTRGVVPLENWINNKEGLQFKLDLVKVKRHLKRVYERAKKFMHKESLSSSYKIKLSWGQK
ncbi:unnamed protein product [Camellia sinensis]